MINDKYKELERTLRMRDEPLTSLDQVINMASKYTMVNNNYKNNIAMKAIYKEKKEEK